MDAPEMNGNAAFPALLKDTAPETALDSSGQFARVQCKKSDDG
jgi:hypothetical protein